MRVMLGARVAGLALSLLLAGSAAAMQPIDATNWTFRNFQGLVRDHARNAGETNDAYQLRLRALIQFTPHQVPKQEQTKNAQREQWLTKAIADKYPPPKVEVKREGKQTRVALHSTLYLFNAQTGRWSRPALAPERRGGGTDHSEQDQYKRYQQPVEKKSWVGFSQNEYPCKAQCIPYFKAESRKRDIGFVFTVTDSGGYAADWGKEPGSTATIYVVDGEAYEGKAPEGLGAPATGPR
jgi:hypothetical protein